MNSMRKTLICMLFLFVALSVSSQFRVTIVKVNLRSTPERKNNKIGTIPKGTKLMVLSTGINMGCWVAVRYNGTLGYIHSDCLKKGKYQKQ